MDSNQHIKKLLNLFNFQPIIKIFVYNQWIDFLELMDFMVRNLQVSHIVLSTEDLAKVLLGSLEGIEEHALKMKTFERLARKYSACGSRKKGGDLGWLEPLSQAPELYQAAQESLVGEVRGPVKTKYGYHIFIVTDEAKMVDSGKDGMDLPLGAGPGTL